MALYRRFSPEVLMARDLVPSPRPGAAPPAIASDAAILEAWLRGRNPRTLRAYAHDLADFARFAGAPSAEAAVEVLMAGGHGLANRLALAYRAHLTERKLAPATIARRLAALRSLVKLARQLGRITWSLDVESPRTTPYRDTRGPGLDGWRKIHAQAYQVARRPAKGRRGPEKDAEARRNLAILRLLHDLMLRRGEVAALDWPEDVELTFGETGRIHIIGKGKAEKEPRTLNAPARDALREWVAARGVEPGPLFVRLDPAATGLDRLEGEGINRMVRRTSRRAGLRKEARAHGLRHQGITRALDKTGGDVRKVQKASRHAKLETLLKYDDARRDDAGDIARLLGED
jgi:integrase/recombinase XerC